MKEVTLGWVGQVNQAKGPCVAARQVRGPRLGRLGGRAPRLSKQFSKVFHSPSYGAFVGDSSTFWNFFFLCIGPRPGVFGLFLFFKFHSKSYFSFHSLPCASVIIPIDV